MAGSDRLKMDKLEIALGARRLNYVSVAIDTIVLLGVVFMGGQHPQGRDELNFLETGLPKLGDKGNPKAFLRSSLLYDLIAVLDGAVFLVQGLSGSGWDQIAYIESYFKHRHIFLLGVWVPGDAHFHKNWKTTLNGSGGRL